jgi:hypothetical protein
MCAEASTVLRAVVGDFSINCCYLEIPSGNRIQHIARCGHDHVQTFQLVISQFEFLVRNKNFLQWSFKIGI